MLDARTGYDNQMCATHSTHQRGPQRWEISQKTRQKFDDVEELTHSEVLMRATAAYTRTPQEPAARSQEASGRFDWFVHKGGVAEVANGTTPCVMRWAGFRS